MLTLGDLLRDAGRLRELSGADVLVAASGTGEVLVQDNKRGGDATMVFMHETIAMMRAERVEKLEKLRGALDAKSPLLAIAQKPGSLWDHITLGRASTSDIVLDDPAVSSVHAHFGIDPDDGHVSIEDVGSSNGTFVNREPLQPGVGVSLQSGDCVRFGQTVFYYVNQRMLQELMELS